jgi:ADP-ribose pyrophosphatase
VTAARRFEWLDVRTVHRDVIVAASHGEEVRWVLSRETVRDTATGRVLERLLIRHPGIVVVVPFLAEDRIVLIRQYRLAVDGELWELPAGTLPGREASGRVVATESPAECAARELAEETGYRAAEWQEVAAYHALPGLTDERAHLFFARGLTPGPTALEEGEVIHEARGFTAAEIAAMIRRGEIRDAKTLIGLFYALAGRPGGLRLDPPDRGPERAPPA